MTSYVVYHDPCIDGCSAAAAAYADWYQSGRAKPYKFVPTSVDGVRSAIRNLKDDSKVFFLDIAPPEGALRLLADRMEKVVVLDHHKTNEEDLKAITEDPPENVEIVFEMDKSGAVLAWEYFRGYVPVIVYYVEDRDLWNWNLDYTDQVTLALMQEEKTPENFFNKIVQNTNELFESGRHLTSQRDSVTDLILKESHFVSIGGYVMPAANAQAFVSVLGHRLMEKYPEFQAAAVYRKTRDNTWRVSLRSKGNFDVGRLAKKFGGGGHKHSAGCELGVPPESISDTVDASALGTPVTPEAKVA